MKSLSIAFAFACVVALAGCGSDPKTAQDYTYAPAVVQIDIKDGKVVPQGERVEIKVGQEVELRVSSDQDDEIHVHSSPEHEFEVKAGATDDTFTFSIKTPGQVAVESHELAVTIAQLVAR